MSNTHGKGIARVGDQVTCPERHHGTTVIVTGDPTMIIDGKPAARHGDKYACGATLISSQFISTVGDGAAGSMPKAASEAQLGQARSSGLISAVLPENHAFDLHFVVRDEKTGEVLPKVPYRITLKDGTSISGVTDANGLTDKISSNTKQPATLEVHHHGDDGHGGSDANSRYDACCC
jgi:hypothetical protein